MSGYNEATLTHIPSQREVYGQDGYGWYCDKETAELLFPTVTLTANLNPIWFTLDGMTRRKLRAKGFVA